MWRLLLLLTTLLAATTALAGDGFNESFWPTQDSHQYFWSAAQIVPDGTYCAAAEDTTINSGPTVPTIVCQDNDGSVLQGSVQMPLSYRGGAVHFTLSVVQVSGAEGNYNADVVAQCCIDATPISNSWGSSAAQDKEPIVRPNDMNFIESEIVVPSGTCEPGSFIFWKQALSAAGTTAPMATVHIIGMGVSW